MADDFVTMEVTPASLRAFDGALLAWQAQVGKSAGEIMRKAARLLCVSFAYSTQPYGDGESARRLGIAAVTRDVARVYATVNEVFRKIEAVNASAAKGFYKAVRTGDFDRAREIMQEFGLRDYERLPIGRFDPSIHDQLRLRNHRGRIGPRTKPRQIVTDSRALAAYQRRMAARVGFAKSSWASCADRVGGSRGIPQWAKKWRAPASVRDYSDAVINPSITLSSGVRYMDIVLPDAEQAKALDAARGRMLAEMRRALEATARKAKLAA